MAHVNSYCKPAQDHRRIGEKLHRLERVAANLAARQPKNRKPGIALLAGLHPANLSVGKGVRPWIKFKEEEAGAGPL
jgi:hypothetical protein